MEHVKKISILRVDREPAGTSFLARLHGYEDADAVKLVDDIHPSLGLFKAPLAACYKGDFPTGDIKILLQTTSFRHPHLKESLPMQVLDMIENRGVQEFDFFMVASDISRVQLADNGNVNVLHHPWCYPNTQFKGKDFGNWHMGAYTFAGLPGVYPTKPKVDLAFQTTGAMRVSIHSQKYGMACSPNNARVSLFPSKATTTTPTTTPTTPTTTTTTPTTTITATMTTTTTTTTTTPTTPTPTTSTTTATITPTTPPRRPPTTTTTTTARTATFATPTATPTPPTIRDPVRVFVSLAIEDRKTQPRCCVTLHWWLLDASIVNTTAYSTWLSRFDHVVATAQTIGELVNQLTTISLNCGDANLEAAGTAVVSTLLPCVGVKPKWLHTQLQSTPVPTQRGPTSTVNPKMKMKMKINSTTKHNINTTNTTNNTNNDTNNNTNTNNDTNTNNKMKMKSNLTTINNNNTVGNGIDTNDHKNSSNTDNNNYNGDDNDNSYNDDDDDNNYHNDDDDHAVTVVGTTKQLTRAQKRNRRRKEIRKKKSTTAH